MHRFLACLLLGSSLLLPAQTPAPALHWSTELDLLPVATGGWYAGLGLGRNEWRVRLVAADLHVPGAFSPRGWEDARTRAQALLLDRFFRPGCTGPWLATGLERWDEDLKRSGAPDRVRLRSGQATLGAGWLFDLGRGWTLDPWAALHQRIAGDREAASGSFRCRPRPLQAEVSLKVGYAFN